MERAVYVRNHHVQFYIRKSNKLIKELPIFHNGIYSKYAALLINVYLT